jgi:hypothetical protein
MALIQKLGQISRPFCGCVAKNGDGFHIQDSGTRVQD